MHLVSLSLPLPPLSLFVNSQIIVAYIDYLFYLNFFIVTSFLALLAEYPESENNLCVEIVIFL
jgi:hypothetical protein